MREHVSARLLDSGHASVFRFLCAAVFIFSIQALTSDSILIPNRARAIACRVGRQHRQAHGATAASLAQCGKQIIQICLILCAWRVVHMRRIRSGLRRDSGPWQKEEEVGRDGICDKYLRMLVVDKKRSAKGGSM
jgi:hypothetical protein